MLASAERFQTLTYITPFNSQSNSVDGAGALTMHYALLQMRKLRLIPSGWSALGRKPWSLAGLLTAVPLRAGQGRARRPRGRPLPRVLGTGAPSQRLDHESRSGPGTGCLRRACAQSRTQEPRGGLAGGRTAPHLLSDVCVIRHICCWRGGGAATAAASGSGSTRLPLTNHRGRFPPKLCPISYLGH